MAARYSNVVFVIRGLCRCVAIGLLVATGPPTATAYASPFPSRSLSASIAAATTSVAINDRETNNNNLLNPRRNGSGISNSFRARLGRGSERNGHQRRRARQRHRLSMSLLADIPRGGAAGLLSSLAVWNETPEAFFNTVLVGLAALTASLKILQRGADRNVVATSDSEDAAAAAAPPKPASIKSLQIRFLAVFWLLRCADWLQGPYFYEVYAGKTLSDGMTASMAMVSRLFLTGFASTALFGPSAGSAADQYGRKRATLAFAVIYALGAISTRSSLLQVLFVGRILSGVGTSLLHSAPESWLVGEAQKSGDDPDGRYLGETFGTAYAGDSLVAIAAGQMAGAAASNRGPTGPFELSGVFLAAGGLLAAFLWNENTAVMENEDEKPGISEAVDVVLADPKIMLVGAVQSLFEAAMYIFVLQWPPAVSDAIAGVFGQGSSTPFGTVFSCFMTCCLLGSTLFGQLVSKMSVPAENFAAGMLSLATAAMTVAALTVSTASTTSLAGVAASFFAFEACVGMYFPAIGTLRSKYIPDSHRSVIMNLFGIPLNVLVVSVFLSIDRLGLQGALAIASGALGVATLCMYRLRGIVSRPVEAKA